MSEGIFRKIVIVLCEDHLCPLFPLVLDRLGPHPQRVCCHTSVTPVTNSLRLTRKIVSRLVGSEFSKRHLTTSLNGQSLIKNVKNTYIASTRHQLLQITKSLSQKNINHKTIFHWPFWTNAHQRPLLIGRRVTVNRGYLVKRGRQFQVGVP